MKIFSEKTNQYYPTVAECEDAEVKFDEEQKQLVAQKEALAQNRKERAKEIEELFSKRSTIDKEIKEKLNAFTKDYGSFHMTVRDEDMPISPFSDLFSFFF